MESCSIQKRRNEDIRKGIVLDNIIVHRLVIITHVSYGQYCMQEKAIPHAMPTNARSTTTKYWPYTPKLVLDCTGNPIWYAAAARPFNTITTEVSRFANRTTSTASLTVAPTVINEAPIDHAEIAQDSLHL